MAVRFRLRDALKRAQSLGSAMLVVAALALPPVPATAQAYAIKQCDPPAAPLGHLRALGQVSYLLDQKGRPDTASVRVLSADHISIGGLRSAAVRILSACAFQSPGKTPTGVQSVTQTIRLDDLKVQISSAEATPKLEADLVIVPQSVPDTPLEVTDSLLEERPHQLICDRSPVYPIISGSSHSLQQANDARVAWERNNSGTVRARMIIGIDGRIEDGSITIISSTNPLLVNIFGPVFASCRYAVGRIGGVPVRTAITIERSATFTSGPD